MSENIKDIMGTTMDKIKAIASADTIIGDPITIGSDITAIPISKVSYGFASGGSDFSTKSSKEMFGGGGGAGMTITPVAFLIVQNNEVKIISIDTNPTSTDKVVSMIPEFFDKVVKAFKKDKKEKEKEK